MTSQSKDEAEWRAFERLDQGSPAADEDDARLRAPYERLVDRLRKNSGARDVPAGWDHDFDVCWHAERRRVRRRNVGVAAVAFASLVVTLLVTRFSAAPAPMLELAVVSGAQLRRGDAAVGDILRVRARGGSTVTLLVYRQQVLMAACPGDDRCGRDGQGWVFELPLRAAGTYHLVWTKGPSTPFLPRQRRLDSDSLEARELGVEWELRVQLVSP